MRQLMYVALIALFFPSELFGQKVEVKIDPEINKPIQDVLNLERKKYFNLSDPGRTFESNTNNQVLQDKIINDYDVQFGRDLGGVESEVKWGNSVFEDAARPGYVDVAKFKSNASKYAASSPEFEAKFAPNLNVAQHDRSNAYPSFMDTYTDPKDTKHSFPSNNEAAAELAVLILKEKHSDFTRPAFYELVNEPHWAHWGSQKFADWHTATWQKAKDENIETEIGGPCMSVSYFYKKSYANLKHLTQFIDNTKGKLDFYSFHTYDYMDWDDTKKEFTGSVTSGLPLDGIIDALSNYMVNNYDKDLSLVLSEHGGYLNSMDEWIVPDSIANTLIGAGSGWDWELKRRSLSDHIMVRSAIANTMSFMNHPHVVKKAVPFILNYTGWNKRYYASLLIAHDYTDKNNLIESSMNNYYKMFAGVSGRRIYSTCSDPDIQYQSFVNNDKVYIILNNLADVEADFTMDIVKAGYTTIKERRLGRNADKTPNYTESALTNLDNFKLGAREAVTLTLTYPDSIVAKDTLKETPYYSDKDVVNNPGTKTFNISMPEYSLTEHAQLRISIGRPMDTDRNISVTLNGTKLEVPMEDAADLSGDESNYGSLKLINIEPSLLKASNTVIISFPDGKAGDVGSVIIRAFLTTEKLSALNESKLVPEGKLMISPNPVTEKEIHVTFKESVKYSPEYSVHSIAGKKVISGKLTGKGKQNIQFRELAAGTYFLKYQVNNISYADKLVVL